MSDTVDYSKHCGNYHCALAHGEAVRIDVARVQKQVETAIDTLCDLPPALPILERIKALKRDFQAPEYENGPDWDQYIANCSWNRAIDAVLALFA